MAGTVATMEAARVASAASQQLADRLAVQEQFRRGGGEVEDDLGVPGHLHQFEGVIELDLIAQGGQADGAIHRAGIEEIEVQFLGHGVGDGGFSGSGRAVDRDDHAESMMRNWAKDASSEVRVQIENRPP